MHVPITNGIIPLDMHSHLPLLPMITYCRSKDAAEDGSGVHYTIQQRVRICRIVLQIPSHSLDELTVPLDETPGLLSLSSTPRHTEDTKITIGTPNLLHLTSHGPCLRKILPLLDSAFSIVTPKSPDIQSPGYLTLGTLLIQLQNAPSLEELSTVSNSSISRPPVSLRPLWPISVSNPMVEWTFEDWRDLIRTMLGHDNDDLCFLAIYRPSLKETPCPSVSCLEHGFSVRHANHAPSSTQVLPPSVPKSERPGYSILYTNADTLNGDILLTIFKHYRLDNEDWNRQLRWCKLSHVCGKWRHLIHQSFFHLSIHILFTNGTPTLGMLAHLPPFPLIIDYRGGDAADGGCGLLHAIQQCDRILRVVLQAPFLTLERLLVPMDEPFPRLESLSLLSTTKSGEGKSLMLPRTFLAPHLSHLSLGGISLPKGLPVLASTFSLLTLKLTDIQSPGYFAPATLVTRLQQIPQLEELSIGFSTPLPRPGAEGELSRPPITLMVLPALRRLTFRGMSVYLEDLVSRISSPLLERCSITLFNQLNFTLSHLSRFTRTTETLRHPVANVIFNQDGVSFVVSSRDELNDGTFNLRVSCKPFDWQIDSATQVCSALEPVLSAAEELTLDFDEEDLPSDWQNEVDAMTWHGLLWPFTGVKKLCIGYPLASELSNALGSDDVGLLPELEELEAQVELGHLNMAFAAFIDARELAGRHVRLSVSPVAISTTVPTPVETGEELPGSLQSTPHEDKPPVSLQSTPHEDEPPVLLPAAPVQKNWFRKSVVEPVRRRLRSRTTRAGV